MLQSFYFLFCMLPFFIVNSEYNPSSTVNLTEDINSQTELPMLDPNELANDFAQLATPYAPHNSGPIRSSVTQTVATPPNSSIHPFICSKGKHANKPLPGAWVHTENKRYNTALLQRYMQAIQQTPEGQTPTCPADPQCSHSFSPEEHSMKSIHEHFSFQHMLHAYGCLICNTTFARSDLLIRHMTTNKSHTKQAKKQILYPPEQELALVTQLFTQQTLPQKRVLRKKD